MQWKEKRVLVFGAGKSGVSATKLLQKHGAYVVLYDTNQNLKREDFKDKFNIDQQFELVTGSMTEDVMDTIDLLILSPGVPTDLPVIDQIRQKQVPVWGEIELAYQFAKGRIIGITGTNGKTTTTALVGQIMKEYQDEVFVVGNIGIPFTDIAMDTTKNSIIVAELSSFQLETIQDFKPDISAILNITPDHLNRHHTMTNYIKAKENIAKNQGSMEVCVLNYEDEELRGVAERLPTNITFFSSKRKLTRGIYLENETIYYATEESEELICSVNELKVLGAHSYENVMAGVAIAIHMGIPMDCIKRAVTAFQAVEHRIEYVETISGVTFYNDSKGTNPDASIKAVEAMRSPTILIGGGYDKGSTYDQWIESFHGKIKCLILLGQTKNMIAETAMRHGFYDIVMVETLKEAVMESAARAEKGDAVLLSPACASWGMFQDYEERGRLFKEYVREMLE